MPNRYHSPFSKLRIKGSAPPPTGERGPRASLPQESAKGRPTSKNNAKSNRGLGMKVVKTFVAGEYMKGNPGRMLFGDSMGGGGGRRMGRPKQSMPRPMPDEPIPMSPPRMRRMMRRGMM